MKATTQGLMVGMLLTLLAPGCADAIAQRNYRADAAAVLATEIELGGNAPAPEPDEKTHGRSDCPTSGWNTHGDGHRTRCQQCRPAWSEASEKASEGTGLAVRAEPEPIPEVKDIRRRLPAEVTDPSPADGGRRRLFRWRLFRRS